MKRLLAALALSASAAFAAPKGPAAKKTEPPLSQTDVGRKLIFSLLGANPDSVAANLEDSLRSQVTAEAVQGLRSQISWLYDILGGDFVEFFKGTRTFDDSSTAFYREYQMANAYNDRAPILLVQVFFADSLADKAMGIQVKSFLGNDKQITGPEIWKVEGKDVDIHSVIVVDAPEGPMLAVRLFDEDTAVLDRERVGRVATPVIREAIARGYLDSVRVTSGKEPQSTIGTVFIRKDANQGFIHARVAFRPEEYAPGGLDNPGEPSSGGKEGAKAPAKTPAKKPAAKKAPAKPKK
jgi:hypothetical protein